MRGWLGSTGPRHVGAGQLSAWNVSGLRTVSLTGRAPNRQHHSPGDHPENSQFRARFLSWPGLPQGIDRACLGTAGSRAAALRGSSKLRLQALVLRLGGGLSTCTAKSQGRLTQTPRLGKVQVGWCCHQSPVWEEMSYNTFFWNVKTFSRSGVVAPAPTWDCSSLQHEVAGPQGCRGGGCQLPLPGQKHGGSDKPTLRPRTWAQGV